MSWQSAALTRIKALIEGAEWQPEASQALLTFEQVHVMEPKQIPYRRYACFWYAGVDSQAETLGNVMRIERLPFRAYWQLPDGTPEESERVEMEIIEAHYALMEALNGDRGLSSGLPNITLTPGIASTGYEQYPLGPGAEAVAEFRVLSMDLMLENLEGEAIAT